MTEFVKTVTTKLLVRVIDQSGPNCTFISIDPNGDDEIQLVIGARFKDRCASRFGKNALAELIEVLQEVHSAMK